MFTLFNFKWGRSFPWKAGKNRMNDIIDGLTAIRTGEKLDILRLETFFKRCDQRAVLSL
jgi:hypothetical protein